MSDTTQVPANAAGEGDIPDVLKRTAPPSSPETKKASASSTAAKVTTTSKSTKKPVASAKAPHQPSKVVSTTANPSKSIVPPKYKTIYALHDGTNGDTVAVALKALETPNADGRPTLGWDTIQEVAKANGIDVSAYAKLNNGQKRMNLGNKLRGMVKAGKPVQIGKRRIANVKPADPVQAAA